MAFDKSFNLNAIGLFYGNLIIIVGFKHFGLCLERTLLMVDVCLRESFLRSIGIELVDPINDQEHLT